MDRLAVYPALIICPKGIRPNWKREIEQWSGRQSTRIKIVRTGKDSLDGDVVIISYDLAARRADELKRRDFQLVLIDEAHALRNARQPLKGRTATRAAVVVNLALSIPRRIPITGTPKVNKAVDLFAQAVLGGLWPWNGFFKFAMRFGDAKKEVIWTRDEKGLPEQRTVWNFDGTSNMKELQALFRPVMIRRRYEDVMKDLPKKLRGVLSVESHDVGIKEEREVRGLLRGLLTEVDGSVEHALELFRERHGTGGAEDGERNPVFKLYATLGMAKSASISDYLVHSVTHDNPTVVFFRHIAVMEAIWEATSKEGIRVGVVHGGISMKRRSEAIEAFQAGKLELLLVSLGAGTEGEDMSRAKEVVFAQLPWEYKTLEQAEARAIDIKNPKTVSYRYALVPGSFDEAMWAMIERKAQTAGEIIDNRPDAENLRMTESPLKSVVRLMLEDELIAMRQGDKSGGRWKPHVSSGRTKVLAA